MALRCDEHTLARLSDRLGKKTEVCVDFYYWAKGVTSERAATSRGGGNECMTLYAACSDGAMTSDDEDYED